MDDLAAHQVALEQHFGALARARHGKRVFALEHGLDQSARREVLRLLSDYCVARPPSSDHWLLWTVYATELGYEYSGREYWQTFEKQTQGWQPHGSRAWIRECFARFSATYSGLTPSGSWAEHFSIICWPIVHAILPRDLQTRIAKILYDIRHSFTALTLGDPRSLGSLIATRGWMASARLEQLADDEELIGSIALALLFPKSEHSGLPLLPATIARIADDLTRQRHAREWLRDAQGSAGGVELKGPRKPHPANAKPDAHPSTPDQVRQLLDHLGVHPTLRLSPTSSGWLVVLGLPNLAPLLSRFPKLRDYLSNARPMIVGGSGERLARQRVLRGDEHVRLHIWPKSTDVLLEFEAAPDLLRTVLSAECLLRPGPTWLFRIGSDKLAYELRGRALRPGQEYVILTTEESIPSELGAVTDAVDCAGICAHRLRVPVFVSDSFVAALRAINMKVARTLRVRPAGLAAAGWDGNGFGEWLVHERVCLVVTCDHDIANLRCRLTDAGEVTFSSQLLKAKTPAFVEFPTLPVGAHVVEFELTGTDGTIEAGEIELLVRDRRPWAPGLSHDGAISVIVDPPAPTLEQLWSDQATIDVHGPADHEIRCKVRFWRRQEPRDHHRVELTLKLPVDRQRWAALFREHCRLHEPSQNAYDHSDRITIEFVAPGVGRFELTAEREFTPLRWAAQHKNQHYSLKLIDDRGVEGAPTILHFPFDAPASPHTLSASPFLADGVEVEGGLYVARGAGETKAITVAPRTFALQKFFGPLRVAPIERSVDAIMDVLRLIELWSHARQVGSAFSLMFAVPSFRALVNCLYSGLAGHTWAALESGSLHELRGAIGHDGIGRRLSDTWFDYARLSPSGRIDLFEKTLSVELANSGARRHSRERLAEVALRFASDPGGVRNWAGTTKRLQAMINLLIHSELATRAARYLVLSIAQHQQSHLDSLNSSWEWS